MPKTSVAKGKRVPPRVSDIPTILLEEFPRVEKLTKRQLKMDAIDAGRMGKAGMRTLVDLYYMLQEVRKASENQWDQLKKSKEPVGLLTWFAVQVRTVEESVVNFLDATTDDDPVAKWAKSQVGIGPVLAAGLSAHLDIEKAPNTGAIWRFCGLDPSVDWLGKEGAKKLVTEHLGTRRQVAVEDVIEIANKLKRRQETILKWATLKGKLTKASLISALARPPYNQRAKVLAWKIGDSFNKLHNHKDCVFGHIYRKRKLLEIERNDAGLYRETAENTLANRKISDKKTRETYESGRLPDGRLELRARRKAVKLFLACWFRVAYVATHRKEPADPYPIEYLGHTDCMLPPGYEAIQETFLRRADNELQRSS